jgi:hypothetical protein
VKYRLTVEQFEPNPDFAKELAEYNARERYMGNDKSYPTAERQVRVLTCELTDEEFAAVKKAALAAMA